MNGYRTPHNLSSGGAGPGAYTHQDAISYNGGAGGAGGAGDAGGAGASEPDGPGNIYGQGASNLGASKTAPLGRGAPSAGGRGNGALGVGVPAPLQQGQLLEAAGAARIGTVAPAGLGSAGSAFSTSTATAAAAAAAPPRTGTETRVFSYKGKQLEIRNVYRDTWEQELAQIREVATKYKVIAMDTEFPGVVARPLSAHRGVVDFAYQTMRCNVDLLKIIQIGLAFCDESGSLASGCPCWQFNFHFNLDEDLFAQDSIDLLKRSGIDFKAHASRGINAADFAEQLMMSGLVLCPDITWVSFHGGYDFGYLLKMLTGSALPADQGRFFELMRTYFPRTFDEKFLMTECDSLHQGGLNRLATDLEVRRIGQTHQAGSDSLLTMQTFFKLKHAVFGGELPPSSEGRLYGYNAK